MRYHLWEATCLKKYGQTHTVKLNEIQNKIKKTYLEKYGVTHNSQVTEIFEKMNKNGYASKDYIFPSGKVVRIRGYEWKALDELLKIYDESEIEVDTKKYQRLNIIGLMVLNITIFQTYILKKKIY